MRTKSATENADVDHYYVKGLRVTSTRQSLLLSRFLLKYDSLSSVRCEYWTPGRIQFCIKTLSVVGRCLGGVVVSARRTSSLAYGMPVCERYFSTWFAERTEGLR